MPPSEKNPTTPKLALTTKNLPPPDPDFPLLNAVQRLREEWANHPERAHKLGEEGRLDAIGAAMEQMAEEEKEKQRMVMVAWNEREVRKGKGKMDRGEY